MSSSYWKDHESKISSVVPGPRNRRPMQRASENSKSDAPSTKSSSKTDGHQHDDNSHTETMATAEKSSNKTKLQKAAVPTTTPLAPPLAPSSPAASTDPPTSTSGSLSSNAPAAHAKVDTAPAPMVLVPPTSAHTVVPETIVPAPTARLY